MIIKIISTLITIQALLYLIIMAISPIVRGSILCAKHIKHMLRKED